ncbi:MAG TPA: hypothetical protein PLM29_10520 [Deltaproteobacteria bacterium]|nr:hypothetical protein [Deltaproteobacteria bacterium]
MAFERMKGVKGLVYVPENTACRKKHPCEDCFSCQMCSDLRCELCLKGKAREEPEEEAGGAAKGSRT